MSLTCSAYPERNRAGMCEGVCGGPSPLISCLVRLKLRPALCAAEGGRVHVHSRRGVDHLHRVHATRRRRAALLRRRRHFLKIGYLGR
jgi:hypothetical protein